MSQTFDKKRFRKLVWHDVRHLSPRHSAFGIMLINILAFTPIMTLFQSVTGEAVGASYRLGMMTLMSLSMAAMTPLQLYANIGRQKKRGDIYFAMLPASKLEKYLSILLLSLVIIPFALLTANLAIDSLLTAVHAPYYRNYLWQAGLLGLLSLPTLCNCLLAFVGIVLGFVYANAIRTKGWRTVVGILSWLWLMGFMSASVLLGESGHTSVLWILTGVQVVFAILMAFLGWNKMNKLGY